MQYPPSMRISAPVMNPDALLARNTIAPCRRPCQYSAPLNSRVPTERSSGSAIYSRIGSASLHVTMFDSLTLPIGVKLSHVFCCKFNSDDSFSPIPRSPLVQCREPGSSSSALSACIRGLPVPRVHVNAQTVVHLHLTSAYSRALLF